MRNSSMIFLAAVLWGASYGAVAEERLTLVVKEPVNEEGHPSNLWLYEAEGDKFRQLTWGDQTRSRPRFSPDGSTLAFITTDKDDKPKDAETANNHDEFVASEAIEARHLKLTGSPHGRYLAYIGSTHGGPIPLRLVDVR